MVYYCDSCGNAFEYMKTLNRHVETKHKDTTMFMCDQCPKQFERKDHYIRHLKSCKQKKKESDQCEICLKQFSRKAYVKVHKEKMHKTDNPLPFLWMLDGQQINVTPSNKNLTSTNFEDDIEQHIIMDKIKMIKDIVEDFFGNVCSIIAKFKCLKCNKRFDKQITLKNHDKSEHQVQKKFYTNKCHLIFV